jgi:hypothetical protein
MVVRNVLAAGIVLIGSLFLATPASAGHSGCSSAECYKKVRQPDVYGTVSRPVVLEPGRTQVVHEPAAVVMRPQRVEAIPGHWQPTSSPALYGSIQRHVLVKPGKVSYSHTPAVYKTVHEQVTVGTGTKWKRGHDHEGHEIMCKVEGHAHTRMVARKVLLQPAQHVAHATPAVYRSVTQSVLVSPPTTTHTYQPPVHQWVANAHVIKPATQRVVNHPPVFGSVSETVRVKHGGYAWKPVGHH